MITNYCTSCRWCERDDLLGHMMCRHPNVAVDPVDGVRTSPMCEFARTRGACGLEGKGYQEKACVTPKPDSPPAKGANCDWVEEEDGWFQTGCGETFEFSFGSPCENRFNYCPFCGNRIEKEVQEIEELK